jgi:putative tryptophan/tyrosine transport system substrate-binding protein
VQTDPETPFRRSQFPAVIINAVGVVLSLGAEMRRRDLIKVVAGSAIAWPLAARAQQKEPRRRIGVLMSVNADDPGAQTEAAALKRGLQERGWIEGGNLELKFGWSDAAPDLIQSSAKELVGSQCEVIVGRSTPGVAALLKETHTVPIVFVVVADPIGSGFVQSFARPGGNVTGFQNYEFTMVGKWLQLLKELAPQVQKIGLIYNPTTIPLGFLRNLETITPSSLSVQTVQLTVHDPAEIETDIAALAREPSTGLAVLPDNFMLDNRVQVIASTAKHGLPAVYANGLWTKSGGLISYGPDTPDLFYRAASYVDRILKGEKPADLPVQAATKYELVINLKTAKTLGLTVPPSLLDRADEVID